MSEKRILSELTLERWMTMQQNRFKSYVLWVAVAGLIGMGLIDLGIVEDLTKYDAYIEKVLYIAILLGIINNPTEKKKF